MAAAVLLGAWLRVLLPERQVGLLRVRGRLFDTATLLVLGRGPVGGRAGGPAAVVTPPGGYGTGRCLDAEITGKAPDG